MGWRCRACGSWDIFAAMIGEEQHGGCMSRIGRAHQRMFLLRLLYLLVRSVVIVLVRMSILLVLINSKC